jgi:hypothetical protein
MPPKSKAFSLATNWHDVSIRQFVWLCESSTHPRPLYWQVQVLSNLTGVEIESIPSATIVETIVPALKFLATPYVPKVLTRKTTVEIKGRKFVFDTSLENEPLQKYVNAEAMFLNQAIELDRLQTGDVSRLPYLLAILASDEHGEPIDDVEGAAQALQDMPYATACDVMIFFLRRLKQSVKLSELCLNLVNGFLLLKKRTTLWDSVG